LKLAAGSESNRLYDIIIFYILIIINFLTKYFPGVKKILARGSRACRPGCDGGDTVHIHDYTTRGIG
jgi:hypothetical protein